MPPLFAESPQAMSDELKLVTIYTDGACEPNPGPGGYGAILIYGDIRKELHGGFRLTTNNRMEIFAAIAGLEALKKPCKVKLHSDSKYLVDAMSQGWVVRWKEKGWWRTKKEKAMNIDLWERLLIACERHQVEFLWVKGHAGQPENERADELSIKLLKQPDLPADEGYTPRPPEEGYVAIRTEGQSCRKCQTPVIKKSPRKRRKGDKLFYYEYYLFCPKCETMYMVEEAKRKLNGDPISLL